MVLAGNETVQGGEEKRESSNRGESSHIHWLCKIVYMKENKRQPLQKENPNKLCTDSVHTTQHYRRTPPGL